MRPWLLVLAAACGKVNAVPIDARPDALTVVVTGSATSGVTVTSDVGSISCGTTCAGTFDPGTQVTLTATPAGMVRWSGGTCSGTDTCVVTLTDDLTITATTCNTTPHTSTMMGTIEMYVVPSGCSSVVVDAFGAQGGGTNGGKGAEITGTVTVADGETLDVLVGGAGSGTNTSPNYGYSGGGGSFVARADNTPLVAAGGGGGQGLNADMGYPGVITTAGTDIQGALGGTNGGGGAIGIPNTDGCGYRGSGGGGFMLDGDLSANGGGTAFVHGGAGGVDPTGDSSDCVTETVGGFGGGGAGGNGGGGGGGADAAPPVQRLWLERGHPDHVSRWRRRRLVRCGHRSDDDRRCSRRSRSGHPDAGALRRRCPP